MQCTKGYGLEDFWNITRKHQGGHRARYICIWPNVCVNMHEGAHIGRFRFGAMDRYDHHGHRSPFWVRGVERNGERQEKSHGRILFKGPGKLMWGGPAPGLASSVANSLVDTRTTSVWPWVVRFMLSLGLRARRTPPLLPSVVHSHNHSARRLTRWLPHRSGALPPPLRVAAGGSARSFAAYSIAIAFGAGVGFIAYESYQPFRHTVLAVVRCSRVAGE